MTSRRLRSLPAAAFLAALGLLLGAAPSFAAGSSGSDGALAFAPPAAATPAPSVRSEEGRCALAPLFRTVEPRRAASLRNPARARRSAASASPPVLARWVLSHGTSTALP